MFKVTLCGLYEGDEECDIEANNQTKTAQERGRIVFALFFAFLWFALKSLCEF